MTLAPSMEAAVAPATRVPGQRTASGRRRAATRAAQDTAQATTQDTAEDTAFSEQSDDVEDSATEGRTRPELTAEDLDAQSPAADLVRVYLNGIGKTALLTAAQEV